MNIGKEKKNQYSWIILVVLAMTVAASLVIFQRINSPMNDVVINVNGTEIKTDYLIKRLYFEDGDLSETLTAIAGEELIRQFAVAHVQVTGEEVDQYQRAVLQSATGMTDPEALDAFIQDMLGGAGFTVEEISQLVYTDALSAKLNLYLIKGVQTVDEQVHVQAILFSSEEDLNRALQRINDGEAFEALASELNPTEELREKSGDLGWLARRSLDSFLAARIFDDITVGQVSEPLLFGDSYALFHVVEHEDAREIDPDILDSMKQKAFDDWLAYQREKSEIVIADMSLERVNWIDWQVEKMRKENG